MFNDNLINLKHAIFVIWQETSWQYVMLVNFFVVSSNQPIKVNIITKWESQVLKTLKLELNSEAFKEVETTNKLKSMICDRSFMKNRTYFKMETLKFTVKKI